MDKKTLEIMRQIFDSKIDNCANEEAYLAWCEARDIIEYALAENQEALKQWGE